MSKRFVFGNEIEKKLEEIIVYTRICTRLWIFFCKYGTSMIIKMHEDVVRLATSFFDYTFKHVLSQQKFGF